MKSTSEMIKVMQAYVSGKPIEMNPQGEGWRKCDCPVWNWVLCDYRVKQEPREFWIAYREDNGEVIGLTGGDSSIIPVDPYLTKVGTVKTMKVREVLSDS